MTETATQRETEAYEILREIAQRVLQQQTLPAVRSPMAPTVPPPTISSLAVEDVQRASEAAMELQAASIKLTYPEDWVIFKARDGAEIGFLMDDGCQRVRPLWGITFDRVDFRRDFTERETDDGQFVIEAVVTARSALTGEDHIEVGFRSSLGLFEKAWNDSADKPVERAMVKANIRKSALRNARGRIIRTISGLGATPKARLIECGLDVRRIRGVSFESGSKGGSGGYATEPQVNLICGEALNRKKVAGLDKLIEFSALKTAVEGASLPKAKASKLIERLKAVEPGAITVEEFQSVLGVTLIAEGEDDSR